MDKIIKKKLNEILDKDCNNSKKKLSINDLEKFEKKIRYIGAGRI